MTDEDDDTVTPASTFDAFAELIGGNIGLIAVNLVLAILFAIMTFGFTSIFYLAALLVPVIFAVLIYLTFD